MSEHLEKAQGALTAASSLDHSDPLYVELLDVARVQAAMAQADALERIAFATEHIMNKLSQRGSMYRKPLDAAIEAKAHYGYGHNNG